MNVTWDFFLQVYQWAILSYNALYADGLIEQ